MSLKVRATDRVYTREQALMLPGSEFTLEDYTDIDGCLITAEDQFTSRAMERADFEPGSKEAREQKPMSPGAVEATRRSIERLNLEQGKVLSEKDAPQVDPNPRKNAAVEREAAVAKARQGHDPHPAAEKTSEGKHPSAKRDAL